MTDNESEETPTSYRGSSSTGWHAGEATPGRNGCVGGTGEKPCNGFPILETNRCYVHQHPKDKAKIKKRKAAGQVVEVLEDSVFNNEYRNTTALEGLMMEMYRTLTIIRWLGTKLDDMAVNEADALAEHLTVEITEVEKPIRDRQKSIEANVMRRQAIRTESGMNPWLVWFIREREHFVRVCNLALNVGIKLDKLQLSKRHGEILADAMSAFVTKVGLDPKDKHVVESIIDALDDAVLAAEGPVLSEPEAPIPAGYPTRPAHRFTSQEQDTQ